MGEHKLPRAPTGETVRPMMSIIRLKAAVQEFYRNAQPDADQDTRDYMDDLRATMAWLDRLETDDA